MPHPCPNKLLVEGEDEKRVIPHFMDEHVWRDEKGVLAVHIEPFGGVENLLKPGVIEAASKETGLQALGILVDADDHLEGRWGQIRRRCLRVAPDFPETLPPNGLIHAVPSGPRIGVWIMPDNGSRGMLETFLSLMLAPENIPLWTFASASCVRARGHGAPYVDAHLDKASIHTYLAWIDPPGLQVHQAVLRRALDPKLPAGQPFVRWFMDLFQLSPRVTPAS